MSRTELWIYIAISGAIYQVCRVALGYPANVDFMVDGCWFSGMALLLHWFWNRRSLASAERQ